MFRVFFSVFLAATGAVFLTHVRASDERQVPLPILLDAETQALPPEEKRELIAERLLQHYRAANRAVEDFRSLPPEEQAARRERARLRSEHHELTRADRLRRDRLPLEEGFREWAQANEWRWNRAKDRTGLEELGEPPRQYIDRWEFRGSISIGGAFQFSLHNRWENRQFWIGEGETKAGLTVVKFDPESTSLHVRYGDESRHLPLQAFSRGGGIVEPSDPTPTNRYGGLQQEVFEQFYEKWRAEVEKSEELQGLQAAYARIGQALQETLDEVYQLHYFADVPLDREERRIWRFERRRGLQEGLRHLAASLTEVVELNDQTVQHLTEHPAFTDEDVDEVRMMAVPLALGRYVPYPLF